MYVFTLFGAGGFFLGFFGGSSVTPTLVLAAVYTTVLFGSGSLRVPLDPVKSYSATCGGALASGCLRFLGFGGFGILVPPLEASARLCASMAFQSAAR